MVKRVFDALASAVLLPALAPVVALIALGVRWSSVGPVFYRQTRVGRDGRTFELIKFRTMHVAPAASIETSRDDPRIFPFGRLLREYHLDELPQLWNVLVGDMSVVGPRPTVPEQVGRYSARERGRLAVRPGLTGLAQVSGGNTLPWNERIEVDLDYVRRASLWLDIRIIVRTLLTVARKEGLYDANGRVRDKA